MATFADWVSKHLESNDIFVFGFSEFITETTILNCIKCIREKLDSNKNHPYLLFLMGYIFEIGWSKNIKLYYDDIDAINDINYCIDFGIPQVDLLEVAIKYYAIATEVGSRNAMLQLVVLYKHNKLVKDENKVRKYLEMAKEHRKYK